jgi:dolichol kinase
MRATAAARNLFHFSGVVIPVCYILFGKTTATFFALSLFFVCLTLDILRIRGQLRLGWAEACFKVHERHGLSGSFFYTISAFITVLVFERNVAIAALFVLCVSDPLSSLVGRHVGRVRLIYNKSLEGSLTFFASSFLILFAFAFRPGPSVAVAAIAALTELFTPRFIDDNLSIPIVTAIALTLFS